MNFQVVVLSSGFSKRFVPLISKDVPKALLPAANRWCCLMCWIQLWSALPISSLFQFLYFMIGTFLLQRERKILVPMQVMPGVVADRYGQKPVMIFGTYTVYKLQRADVIFLSAPVKYGMTGTMIVFTTLDSQQAMLACQATSSRINYEPCLADPSTKTNVLVVEGYLFELPDTVRTILKVCEKARKCGAVAITTSGDHRTFDQIPNACKDVVAILFTFDLTNRSTLKNRRYQRCSSSSIH